MLTAWSATSQAQLTHVTLDRGDTQWRAVVVPSSANLAHTCQIFPVGADGRIVAGDAGAQFDQALENLAAVIEPLGAGLNDVVRLNVYAATPEAAALVRSLERTDRPAAVTYVVTALAEPGALVAVDAVATTAARQSPDPRRVRVLRAGGATFVSGMAAPGAMAEATRNTLEQLEGVLSYFGLGRDDVVHVKGFLQPPDQVESARVEVERFFGERAPPASWVEWTMAGPIEIELVAQAARQHLPSADTAAYHNPAPSRASPVFTRAVVVSGGRLIYSSGLYAERQLPAADEVRDILTGLRELLAKAGGDFNHLVKATYYPAGDAASRALNEVRPEFYDPERPPAASKAPVHHTGHAARQLTMDMIGVTPR